MPHSPCRGAIFTAVCLACACSAAQPPLPECQPLPALLRRGDAGTIRLTLPRVVMDEKTEDYTVTVPVTIEKEVAGRTVTQTVVKEEVRTRTVLQRKVVGVEVEVAAGSFDVRRASGERIQILSSGQKESRVVPVIVLEVEQIDQPQIPEFLAAVLKPDAVVVFLPVGALAGPSEAAAEVEVKPQGDPPKPPQPGTGEVTLTVQNQSGRAVSIYFFDEAKDRDVLVNRSLAEGGEMAQACPKGASWTAKQGEQVVSDFRTPGDAVATWRIGPPVAFTTWECADGGSFRRVDDQTWRQYDRGGRSLGMLSEEERTDRWVAMFDQGREMWVRLTDIEAIYETPTSKGWQTLAIRSGATQPGSQPGRPSSGASTGKSALSEAEIKVLLDVHNAARREVGAPPVTWSTGMADYAQRWAEKLAREEKFDHRPNSPYGENLAMANTARDAAGIWYAEKSKYRGDKIDNQNFRVFGHYTQMVWTGTTKIGCGKAEVNGRTIWVCNYDPPGNKVGERPY